MRRLVVALTAVLLLSACTDMTVLTLPDASSTPPASEASTEPATPAPAARDGMFRVAYPDEPLGFVDPLGRDAAAVDLTALWGLPLFRYDAAGQRAPGLVAATQESVAADGTHRVELQLRSGTWSDGSAVTAADVKATVEALREFVPELGGLSSIEVTGASSLTLIWSREVVGWWSLVDALGTVLPAAILNEQGLEAYRDGIPVSGGSYRFESREPGRSLTFVAHDGSPLGGPVNAGIEILVAPRFETALGLLEQERVDVILGYGALNPVPRSLVIPGVAAAAPIGGTTIMLEFRPGGGLGGAEDAGQRREIVANLRLGELVEGLLGVTGEEAGAYWPGADPITERAASADAGGRQLVTVLPRGHEVIGFAARTVQRDLMAIDVDLQFVSFETPAYQRESLDQGGASFRIRRLTPTPIVSRAVIAAPAEIGLAAAAEIDGAAVDVAMQTVADEAVQVPLFRLGIAHAWRDDITGVVASSWPGLGFTSAAAWRRG